ncbi:MAG: TonB family protein [Myxococcota bacterium]
MTDRALPVCIGISLALHLLVIGHGLGSRPADARAVPPEPVAIRLRLRGPAAEVIEAEAPTPAVAVSPEPLPPVPGAPPEPRRPEPVPVPPPVTKPESPPARSTHEPDPRERARIGPTARPVRAKPSSEAAEGVVDPPGVSAAPSDSVPATGQDGDDEDRLARYVEAIRSRVEDRKRYPPLARKRSVEGRVVARVAIGADGRIDAVEYDGRAEPLLRRATESAIRAAAPYPAPPDGAITIELPVDYSLRDAS